MDRAAFCGANKACTPDRWSQQQFYAHNLTAHSAYTCAVTVFRGALMAPFLSFCIDLLMPGQRGIAQKKRTLYLCLSLYPVSSSTLWTAYHRDLDPLLVRSEARAIDEASVSLVGASFGRLTCTSYHIRSSTPPSSVIVNTSPQKYSKIAFASIFRGSLIVTGVGW